MAGCDVVPDSPQEWLDEHVEPIFKAVVDNYPDIAKQDSRSLPNGDIPTIRRHLAIMDGDAGKAIALVAEAGSPVIDLYVSKRLELGNAELDATLEHVRIIPISEIESQLLAAVEEFLGPQYVPVGA